MDSLLLPTVREMVEEDAFGTWGTAIHDWAGLETILLYRTAKDRATFFESWAEFNRRVGEKHPDSDPFLGCNRHRDGLYLEGPRTSPPPPPEEEDMDEAEE